jgi:ATP-dependent Zn protease
MYLQVNEAARKILKAEMDRTLTLLESNRQHLEALAKALQERERLTVEDLKAILPETPQIAAQT